jgi:hypothetical protein
MKVPLPLKSLHRAVSALSQVDLQAANSELMYDKAINVRDAKEVASALNAFKSFFNKIERHQESN